jgi:glycosyltransferase involved in cell wall biosynthesis
VLLLLKPKVTIGVCVRNCEVYIKDTIESILQQDFPHEHMELIFVDDGSKDRTLSIINSFVPKLDMDVKVFRHKWKGLGATRNVVVNNANGEYVIWVDGDMVLSKDFVKTLVEFMEKHPKVGIAKGELSLEPGGNLLATLEMYSRAAGRMVNYQSEKARLKALGTGGAIYRMVAIRHVGRFDENLKGYGEDFDFENRIRRVGWSLQTIGANFLDYERYGIAWKALWKRYWLRGYYSHYFSHKNRGMIVHYRMIPPAAFLSGFLHAHKIFRITQDKAAFLLPFQYVFKMKSWYVGFMQAHLDSYQPQA